MVSRFPVSQRFRSYWGAARELRNELGVCGYVSQRGQAVVSAINCGSAETLLSNVDGFDGVVPDGVPCAQALQDQARAVGQGDGSICEIGFAGDSSDGDGAS